MKKLISLLLVVIMAFSIVACGPINAAEVSILWSGADKATIPGTLIDTMERAMYTENIAYKHYGANGDKAVQLEQIKEAAENGSAALVVNLIDEASAGEVIEIAKAKSIPVIFLDCVVKEEVLNQYDKAFCVLVDEGTLATVREKQIKEFIDKNKDEKTGKNKLDKNGDGKIAYSNCGTDAKINNEESLGLVFVEFSVDELNAEKPEDAKAELIITSNDTEAIAILEKMNSKGFNADKLVTHFIPLFTVGTTADARRLYPNVDELEKEEYDTLIYTVKEIIGTGKISGAVVYDNDTLALTTCKLLGNLLKGKETFDGIKEELISGKTVKVSYNFI